VFVAAIVGLLGLLVAVLVVANGGRAASLDAVSATLTSSVPTDTALLEGPSTVTLPAETITETAPTETIERVLPAETVTVSQTETTTVTETSAVAVVRPGAAVAGAAAANKEETDTSSTQWGWIAFGILAFACVVFGIVWLIRRPKGHKPAAPPAG
jgi:cytoskeletal protein RodZ